ncbi:MAG TPA: methyltransferase [Gemmatimonadaceae bacterium]|nr:methyltransferase [Gemmatimonadaceae bacterium]
MNTSTHTYARSAPATVMIEMARGYQVSQALFVAAKLGIADLLANGPMPSDAIARATATDPAALHRLLRVLGSRGVLASVGDRDFGLTSFGELLRRDMAGSVRDQVLLWGHPMQWEPWGDLLHSVQTGHTAFEKRFGMGHWDYLAQHPDAGEMFKAAQAAHPSHLEVPIVYDFSGRQRIVDVGGGNGQLLAEILRVNRNAHGVLLDRPSVVAGAEETMRVAGVADRCVVVGGDFMTDMPSGGDVYILSNILMDWDDHMAVLLLRKCRDAMGAAGALLVVERTIPADNRPSLSQLGDLMGLVITGGRIRSEPEIHRLFDAAELECSGRLQTAAGYSVLEARARDA